MPSFMMFHFKRNMETDRIDEDTIFPDGKPNVSVMPFHGF